jgi:CheY-like chemotaxis protein
MYRAKNEANEAVSKVLIVDDNDQLRAVLAEGMTSLGFAVDVAADALEAAHLLTMHRYDAIVCDLLMPAISGDELFRRCQVERPEAARRFIFLTGSPLGVSAAEGAASSGQPYLRKPCRLTELRDAILGLQEALSRESVLAG